jgi:hypothetical protein
MSLKPSSGTIFGTSLAFLGAGLGVILTKGQNTWVPNNHWLAPLLFVIGSVLAIWSVFRLFSSRSKAPDERYQHNESGVRSELQGVGNPSLAAGRDIHFNIGTLPSALAPSGLSQESKPETLAPGPNLEYVTSKEKLVFVSPFARDGICDPRSLEERRKSLQALVLKFENRVVTDRKIARAMNVIAKMRFTSEDGVRQRVIDYGVWLNSPSNSTDMGVGDTRELLVVCAMNDKNLVGFEDRREGNHQFYDQFSYLDDGSVDGLEIVEITVIDKNTQATLRCKFRVWREGARFCVARRD